MAVAPTAPAALDTAAAAADDLFKGMDDKDEIARSLAAYKGYLTRTFKEVDRYKADVTANPDEMAVAELQSAHSHLLHYSRIVEAGYVRLQVVDYTQFHTYATKIATMGDELAEASDDVMRIVANSKVKQVAAIAAPPAAAMPAYAAVVGGRVKPNDTLKSIYHQKRKSAHSYRKGRTGNQA